ncbi:MAG: Rne/Rng family ribonuclease [Candidatus Omnitrophica bacterium]|nr:Rne/Rng family ribonuclease [Candidatus Omnitrophota bacterium]MDD5236077.1 Rne/Rng family ribonuclease [Candidatus Omnitrophota bacterium]MDD5611045.1 Rne/Rng family ribonuclease [Candidatus Omnitrophota bacterium]
MSREILIDATLQEKSVAIVDDGRLVEYYIERPQDKTIVGNIYKGIIETVMPAINAAFVDIGLPKKGFLYITDVSEVLEQVDIATGTKPHIELKSGQEVLVQAEKEAFGTKGPRLTAHIGLPGRYLVLTPQDASIGVSRRIEEDEERRRLRQIFNELDLPKGIGFIVRTAAEGRSRQEIERDARFLLKIWQRIEKVSKTRKPPALIYEEYDLTIRTIRDSFTDDVSKVLVNSRQEYYRIIRFVRSFLRHLSKKVELYRGQDIFEDKGIESQVNKIFESKVYLKSKGYLIIEPTEGLVVIDVNSGGFSKKLSAEDAAFKVNAEAAIEAARQIRLRDLGGIIVIDFIDMQREGHRKEIFNILKRELNKDNAKYDIAGISRFGLIELTRERVHRTLATLSFQECPYCKGKGRIKSNLTMSINVLEQLRKVLGKSAKRTVNVYLHPSVADLFTKDSSSIKFMERQFRTKINIVANPNLHHEDISIV